ncbi:MAG: DUF1343 domain-containing protein [Melioribacteraceae bacterium]|nr:DUF1343 domain-containing protein [Melioribacteraceae bacterium]
MGKIITSFLICFLLFTSASAQVKTGIEVLRDSNFEILKGKRIGLITNATGVDKQLKSTIDILHESAEVNLVALYGPEHGVRGNIEAGDKVGFYTDKKTNLPVYSLYGRTRKPSSEMLENIDVLIYDIQDIGCRSYTFISTMGLAMEAAAENNIEFVVLDRPNPLGGNRIEGNITEDDYISFISQFKIPYVYGLTCGELAKMLNNEKMLKEEAECKLTVVEMSGWKRDMTFEETNLPWVMTSPHIPHKDSPYYYVATGVAGELRNVYSIGVGYTIPFQTFAAEWINGDDLTDKLNSYNLAGIIFRPIYYKPFYAFGESENLHGVQLHIIDFAKVNLLETQYYIMQALNELYPDKNPFEMDDKRLSMFDKANGTDKVRKLFEKNFKVADIEEYFKKDVEIFRKQSEKYYLYKW